MYRAGIEGILGLTIHGDRLQLDPCIRMSWPRVEIIFRRGATVYQIVVENPARVSRGVAVAEFDGQAIVERPLRVPILDDGATHRLKITLG